MVQVGAVSGAGQCGLWCRSVRSLAQEGGVDGASQFWGRGPAPLNRLERRFLAPVSRVK